MIGGYIIGPTLAADERPWPTCWEQSNEVAACVHPEWELVLLHWSYQTRVEEAVRCVECHAPRCGHSMYDDPCMRVRHHGGLHVRLSGRAESVGS